MEEQRVDVVNAHEQKEFVNGLSKFLRRVHGLKVVDDSSMATGEYAQGRMLENLAAAAVGVLKPLCTSKMASLMSHWLRIAHTMT